MRFICQVQTAWSHCGLRCMGVDGRMAANFKVVVIGPFTSKPMLTAAVL